MISGAQAAVSAIADRFAEQGRRVHRLAVSHAFHSPLMEPMLEEFARVAARVEAREPQIGLVSNVTGELAGADSDFGSGSTGSSMFAGRCVLPTVCVICRWLGRPISSRSVPVVV